MSSVVIRSADRPAIARAVASYVTLLRARHPEIEEIIWFGSWVTGTPTPGSDVDLCIVLTSSDKRMRDRVPDYLPAGFPVGVDLLPYTRAEFEQLLEWAPTLHAAITSGRRL